MNNGYHCRVERDSVSAKGGRLTTFVIRFPRRVLAETVTHRTVSSVWGDYEESWCERTTTPDVSKNSASSRAIPFERMVAQVREDPFVPHWTRNKKGMQGDPLDDPAVADAARRIWMNSLEYNCLAAQGLHALGIHKQDCNRFLEPWAWTTQVVTSSAWDNFFALRCHEAADPHFRHVARMMFLARRKSTPIPLREGQWHLPFVPVEEQEGFLWTGFEVGLNRLEQFPLPVRTSVARCAWASYENHDKEAGQEAIDRTFSRLLADEVKHSSPAEHQATPCDRRSSSSEWYGGSRPYSRLEGNLNGWVQLRKLIHRERIDRYDPSEEEVASWGMGE